MRKFNKGQGAKEERAQNGINQNSQKTFNWAACIKFCQTYLQSAGKTLAKVSMPEKFPKPQSLFAWSRGRFTSSHRLSHSWHLSITHQVLAVNVLVLLIPVLGLLHLSQYRESLITKELDTLALEGRTFALALSAVATRDMPRNSMHLVISDTRHYLRLFLDNMNIRARVFGQQGQLIEDSLMMSEKEIALDFTRATMVYNEDNWLNWIDKIYNSISGLLVEEKTLPLYEEQFPPKAQDYKEVMSAFKGQTQNMTRVDKRGNLVLSVAVPVIKSQKVLGVLMLSQDGRNIAVAIQERRRDILLFFSVSFALTCLLSLYLARKFTRPIQELAEVAELIRLDKTHNHFAITESLRKRNDEIGYLSRALNDMTLALNERVDAIEGFAADVTHEIKNPLTSLRSAVETVIRIKDDAQRTQLLSIIFEDVQRLDRLITDITDASRLDAELLRASATPVNLKTLLETMVTVHSPLTIRDGPVIEFFHDPNKDLYVSGLEGRLGQVFRNLIINAISFSPPKGRIILRARRMGENLSNNNQKDWIMVTIEDQGPGIPEGTIDAIFDRFYSERPKSEKFGMHSGLGLSISKQIIEAHGGLIRAGNRPQGGARFTVLLPAVPPQDGF